MDEIVHEFLVESYENLDQLDQDFVALEKEPGSHALLSSIFRTVHTIKGTAGFLALADLERVAHHGEGLLTELRDGIRTMDGHTTDVLLALVDKLRECLAAIEAGTPDAVEVDGTIEQIKAVLDTPPGAAAPAEEPEPAAEEPEAAAEPAPEAPEAAAEPAPEAATEPAPEPAPEAAAEAAAEPAPEAATEPAPEPAAAPKKRVTRKRAVKKPATSVADTAASVAEAAASVAEAAASVADVADPAAAPAGAEAPAPAKAPAKPAAKKPAAPAKAGEDAPTSTRTAADSAIRVDVELLDALMRQVSELVIVRTQIDRLAESQTDMNLVRSAQRLNLIAGELQEGVMKTRMQPIEHVWSKMPRVVRDLANAIGRQVSLVMIGGDTELDRSLLEAVKDPLTHLVRNAVDHGIESPEDRVAKGKDPKGTVTLRAYHASGQVVVEITDDGAGIDVDKVAAKAVEKGLKSAREVAEMSPGEIAGLLFLPGFSTAEKVTNISGRGVGMDVVKTKVEGIGGSVDVETKFGRGTTWRMRIPLTLAIMPALTVECAGQTYALAQVNLAELVATGDTEGAPSIEHVGTAPVFRLRGQLLPLISLAEVLGVEPTDAHKQVIAVVNADDQKFGLIVDRVINMEEIVVKAISNRIKQVGIYSGATVLGDGGVALILDVLAIARRELTAEAAAIARDQANSGAGAGAGTTEQMLVVGAGDDRQVAIPLSAVTRLERIPNDAFERVGQREVLQYRGSLLPVVRLDQMLGAMSSTYRDEVEVVVYTREEKSVAIAVTAILDIVEDDVAYHSDIEDIGLLGSTVVKDRVTELLDVEAAVRSVDPDFYDDLVTYSDDFSGDGVSADNYAGVY